MLELRATIQKRLQAAEETSWEKFWGVYQRTCSVLHLIYDTIASNRNTDKAVTCKKQIYRKGAEHSGAQVERKRIIESLRLEKALKVIESNH